jgi:hypothetical protein
LAWVALTRIALSTLFVSHSDKSFRLNCGRSPMPALAQPRWLRQQSKQIGEQLPMRLQFPRGDAVPLR